MAFFDYPGGPETAATDTQAASAPDAQVFLADATEQDWLDLLAHTERRSIAPGEVVISRGDIGRSLFLVLDGSVEVRLPGGRFRGSRRTAVFGPGSVLGEIAFFDGQARSADVIATRPSQIAELTPEGLMELAQQQPRLATAALLDLGRILAQRLRSQEAS